MNFCTPFRIMRIIPWFLVTYLRANLDMARLTLTHGLQPVGRVFRMQLHPCSDFNAYLIANLISFTPGSIVLDLDENGIMEVHVLLLDSANEKRAREELEAFIKVFNHE